MAADEEVLHELQAYLASVCPAVLGLESAEALQKALEAPDACALLTTWVSFSGSCYIHGVCRLDVVMPMIHPRGKIDGTT